MPASRTPLVPLSAPSDPALRALAHQRFPGGVLIDHSKGGEEAAAQTSRLISEGQNVIYDAAMAHDGMLAILDVLVHQRGRWTGYLFRPSTRPKERHFLDAALVSQLWRGAGYELDDLSLLLLNSQYVRRGAINPQELFAEERIGRRMRFDQHELRGRMQMLKRMAAKDRQRAERGEAPYTANWGAQKQKESSPGGLVEIQVDEMPLRSFLNSLEYPLYFMDFEAYQTAIPEYDGHWPFRQLPFQFSVHRLDAPGGELHQTGFIAPGNEEPTAAFGEALLAATGNKGTVVVYNRDSEALILDQLEGDHPQWAGAIDALRRRLVDLLVPFEQQWVRIPSIGNKLSLKYTLPALVPDLGYTALAIADGEAANSAYNRLRFETDPNVIQQIREDLMAYCEVDTLAMVRILDRLRQLAGAAPGQP